MAGASSNADEVAEAIGELVAVLRDLTPAAQAAAAMVLPLAVERAPRRTGRLAASLRTVVAADSYGIDSDEPYAAYVHAEQPWLTDVITATEQDQLDVLDDYLTAHIP